MPSCRGLLEMCRTQACPADARQNRRFGQAEGDFGGTCYRNAESCRWQVCVANGEMAVSSRTWEIRSIASAYRRKSMATASGLDPTKSPAKAGLFVTARSTQRLASFAATLASSRARCALVLARSRAASAWSLQAPLSPVFMASQRSFATLCSASALAMATS